MADIRWDDAAFDDLLNSWDGPVGEFIAELSDRVALVARAAVRVRVNMRGSPGRAGPHSTARPPGFTKADIRSHRGQHADSGRIYGGANVAMDPGIYLEWPARQMNARYPFMTTGLEAIEGGF
jgi:hypothetical protein